VKVTGSLMEKLNLPKYKFNIKTKEQKKYIYDQIRRKFVLLTPEEWVRQNFVNYLIHEKSFSPNLMNLEMGFQLYKVKYRADIVAFDRKGDAALIVECKAPGIPIRQEHFDQITRYNYELKVSYLIVTNGIEHYCALMDYSKSTYYFLKAIPDGTQVHNRN
jgi:hypothetical protein